MGKVYYVIIKGRTLESRDLKALLARAVSEKKSIDRKAHPVFRGQTGENASNACAGALSAAV